MIVLVTVLSAGRHLMFGLILVTTLWAEEVSLLRLAPRSLDLDSS